jgi:hypothetical protein
MRSKLTLCAVLAVAVTAYGKDPKPYQTGTLVQMDSVQCGTAENEHKTVADEMLGTDSGSKNTHELLCQEYVLQAEKVTYRFRPRNEKHPVLLPVGDQVHFRLQNGKMLVRVQSLDDKDLDNHDLDKKEREYVVVAMTPRSDSTAADATPARLNHLQ